VRVGEKMPVLLIRNGQILWPKSYVSISISESTSKFIGSQQNIFDEVIPYSVFDPVASITVNSIGIMGSMGELPRPDDVIVLFEKGMPVLFYKVLQTKSLSLRLAANQFPVFKVNVLTYFVDVDQSTQRQLLVFYNEKVKFMESLDGVNFRPLQLTRLELDLGGLDLDVHQLDITITKNVRLERTIGGITLTGKNSLNASFSIRGLLNHNLKFEKRLPGTNQPTEATIDLEEHYLGKLSVDIELTNDDGSELFRVKLTGYGTSRFSSERSPSIGVDVRSAQVELIEGLP